VAVWPRARDPPTRVPRERVSFRENVSVFC
jgi:hypothetical protein